MAMNGGRLLQPATVQMLQTSLRLPSGEETGYGLGWDLETLPLAGRPTQVVGHDGSEITGIAFDPSLRRLLFSSQRGADGAPGGVTYMVEGPFFG